MGEICVCRCCCNGQYWASWAALIHRLCGVSVLHPPSPTQTIVMCIRLYTKHALWPSIESDIWMSTCELFFVFIWHIDMYLPFCVSIFCCYHACIAWLYQNSLTPLAMYCECFPGQSWGVMTCGDYIKFIYSCDRIYEIYRYVYNNYHSNPVTETVYKHCALLLLSMLTFIFYLSVIIEGHVMSSVHLHLIISTCECSK